MKPFTVSIASAILVTTLILFPTVSASECKGSVKAVCMADNSCSWVNGYKRSDGRKVGAYCRTAKTQAKAKDKHAVNEKNRRKKEFKALADIEH